MSVTGGFLSNDAAYASSLTAGPGAYTIADGIVVKAYWLCVRSQSIWQLRHGEMLGIARQLIGPASHSSWHFPMFGLSVGC